MSPRNWLPGDPVPKFTARASNSPRFHFDSTAGRYIVLTFFGSASIAKYRKVVAHIAERRALFDDERAAWFGVSIDPQDEALPRVQQIVPGIRFFWDFDRAISRLYDAIADDGPPEAGIKYRAFTLLLDPMLRVLAFIPILEAEQHNRDFDAIMAALPPIEQHAGVPMHAPVLIVPRVFEPGFCRELIALYEKQGGSDSGFMREVDGKTVGMLDDRFKKRKDFNFDHGAEFEALRQSIRDRVTRRLVPEIAKAFQFKATRMERYVIACYESESGGFFRAHRDNTTKGTAHRRFACTLNLNTGDYDGGELRFAEFGARTYRAPLGGAVVFSCSLLHEATPVVKGRRYAFLPFLYDEAAAKVREENLGFIAPEVVDANKVGAETAQDVAAE